MCWGCTSFKPNATIDLWMSAPFHRLLRNAFIQAIIPAFDRAVASNSTTRHMLKRTSRAGSVYFVIGAPPRARGFRPSREGVVTLA